MPRRVSVGPSKTCPRCRLAKPLDGFGVRKRSPLGRKSWCRACEAARAVERYRERAAVQHLVYRRGVNASQYVAMMERQKDRCAICRSHCATGRRLAVDHDHQTGRVRGLLCFRCNTTLARYEEYSAEFAAYLGGATIEAATP